MGLYEGIKDVAKVLQQADNVGLYMKLLDLGEQALDLQAEVSKLKDENRELKKAKELDERIIRHPQPYVTLKDEKPEIHYCANCWGKERILIQMTVYADSYGTNTHCHNCKCHFRI